MDDLDTLEAVLAGLIRAVDDRASTIHGEDGTGGSTPGPVTFIHAVNRPGRDVAERARCGRAGSMRLETAGLDAAVGGSMRLETAGLDAAAGGSMRLETTGVDAA